MGSLSSEGFFILDMWSSSKLTLLCPYDCGITKKKNPFKEGAHLVYKKPCGLLLYFVFIWGKKLG